MRYSQLRAAMLLGMFRQAVCTIIILRQARCGNSWAEARLKIAGVTLAIKPDGNSNSFQQASKQRTSAKRHW